MAVAARAPSEVAPTLQAALDDWARVAPALAALEASANEPLDVARLGPPLPRAYEWLDGSAFLNHVVLVRKARGAEPPATLTTDPLVYQGGSGVLLGPTDDISLADPAFGLDFESEVAVILGDVPRATAAADASAHVRLLLLANDITLRNLVPAELAKGFGFLQSKPATAFSPFAVTPDELGPAWRDGRVHLRLRTTLNGELVGDPEAGEMHFSFFDLDRPRGPNPRPHRRYAAGQRNRVERRSRPRRLLPGRTPRHRDDRQRPAPSRPFMKAGDTIALEMRDGSGRDIFGRIEQRVVAG